MSMGIDRCMERSEPSEDEASDPLIQFLAFAQVDDVKEYLEMRYLIEAPAASEAIN